MKNTLPLLFKLYAKLCYSTKWDYPFIPDKACLPNGVQVIYNTVGGKVNPNNKPLYNKITNRIKSADYVSVRDSRTLDQLSSVCDAQLSPDSVFILPDLINDNFLQAKVRAEIFKLSTEQAKYVIQAAPAKINCSVATFTKQIAQLAKQEQEKVILLPIGYASGHDDIYLMEEVHQALPNDTILFLDLNVWEILFVIKTAKAFMGTSLHGVITAMAYGLPHFGLNPAIGKLNAFLTEWSIAPYNQSYDVEKLADLALLVKDEHKEQLVTNAQSIVDRVKINNQAIINTIVSNN